MKHLYWYLPRLSPVLPVKVFYWIYCSPPDKLVCFDYRKVHGRDGPTELLDGFQDTLQSDGYHAYKLFYGAINKDTAKDALDDFEQKWGSKYGYAIKSWKNNYEELTTYFDYPLEIQKIIYTTNTIESLNSGIRKNVKTITILPDNKSAIKAVYLSISNVEQKWKIHFRNWGIKINQFIVKFGDRCRI
jgi:transposase-like protein